MANSFHKTFIGTRQIIYECLKLPIHEFFGAAVYENDLKSDFHINTVIFRRVSLTIIDLDGFQKMIALRR